LLEEKERKRNTQTPLFLERRVNTKEINITFFATFHNMLFTFYHSLFSFIILKKVKIGVKNQTKKSQKLQ